MSLFLPNFCFQSFIINYMIILGDCLEKLKDIKDNSVDLIFTSVPDMNDLGIKDITEYEDFISLAMVKFEQLISDTGFVAMCQTDRKIGGRVGREVGRQGSKENRM